MTQYLTRLREAPFANREHIFELFGAQVVRKCTIHPNSVCSSYSGELWVMKSEGWTQACPVIRELSLLTFEIECGFFRSFSSDDESSQVCTVIQRVETEMIRRSRISEYLLWNGPVDSMKLM